METLIGSGFTLLLGVVFVYVISRAFKIIRPYERGLVERLGKFASERSPGLNVIIPVSYTHLTLPTKRIV